ncbi:acyltransferase family protein [Microvirga aerophila]|uniref:Acyltransferase n=1 Tax=Microvirga aerophila TaxID=670291 RepID=A0A512C1R7_9HYPH|nr:acyltransferase family protein [Microvirga aerophila]GEO18168.1 acyltransferase [Microvirga aerophila]
MLLSSNLAPRAQYYPYIDGLRALAVLSVLIYHLHGPWLPGGFVGVDVFFVISGFVVSASIASFKGQGIWQFLTFFYARRLRRIAPALIVCLLVTAVLTGLLIPPSWLSAENQKTGLYAFFGLSNFALAKSGRDYFAPTTDFNPYTHTWSLAVEEQFYLVFPFLFLAWTRGGRGRALSAALVAGTLLASLGWGWWQSQASPVQAYFLTPSRFWELAAGVLLYQLISHSSQRIISSKHASGVRGIFGAVSLLSILAAFAVSASTRFPVPGVLPAVIGTLGVIWSLHHHPELKRLHGLLGNRSLVFVGRISYSLYLWHWPVFVLFRWTWGLESLLPRVLAIALAFVLALASWRFVENPIRYGRGLSRIPQGAVIAGSLLVVTVGSLGAKVIADNQHRLSFSTVSRNPEIWYPHVSPTNVEDPDCNAEPERQTIAGGRLLIYSPKGCVQPRQLSNSSIYVIGDSHAMAYEGLLKQYAIHRTTRIYAYTNGGCPFISLQPSRDLDDARCRHYTDAALSDLQTRLRPGDVLFLPSLRLPRFSDQWIYFGQEQARSQMFGARADAGRRRSVAFAVATLRDIAQRGVHIVLEGPKPVFEAPPFRCADWFNRANPICAPGFSVPRSLLDAFRQPVLQAFERIAQQVPDVSVWDPYPLLCPEEQCQAWRDGQPLFLDGDHISGSGNKLLLPSFTEAMDARLGIHSRAAGR